LCAQSTAIRFAPSAAEGRIAADSLSDPTETARDFAFSLPRRALSRHRSQAPENHDTDRCAKNQMFIGVESFEPRHGSIRPIPKA
jgi:hypothetical protein